MPVPISVSISTTSPSSILQTRDTNSTSQSSVSFGISVRGLSEKSQNGHEIFTLLFNQSKFISSHAKRNTSKSFDYEMWVLSTDLSNGAYANVTFIQCYANSIFPFLHGYECPPDTLKINVKIGNWPFKSSQNFLQVIFDVEKKEDGKGVEGEGEGEGKKEKSGCPTGDTQKFYGPGLTYTSINFMGTILSTRFLPDAIVDGRYRKITFTPLGSYSVVASIPHFWTVSEIDPNYAILLDIDGCSVEKNSISSTLVIAIVVPVLSVVFVLALVFGVFYSIRTKKLKNKKRRVRSTELTHIKKTTLI